MATIKIRRFKNRSNVDRLVIPWAREVEERIQELEVSAERRAAADLNTNKSQTSSGNRLAATVKALPIPVIATTNATGFSLTAGGTQTVATTSLAVPEGKNWATFIMIGSAAAVDLTTGGATTCYMSMSLDSLFSQEYSSAKDAGASAVNNIMNGSFGGSLPVSGLPTLTATLRLRPLNAAAFGASAGNYASLSVLALFT